jgi:hypothetical protein
MQLNTHLHLVQVLKMHGAAPPLPNGMYREKFTMFEVLTAVMMLKSSGNDTVLLGKWFLAF